jgi:hypothetical protein
MSSQTTAQTVTIGRITYTVTYDFEDGYVQRLGWLTGPRGDSAMICRHNTGFLMAMGSRTLDRVANAVVNTALAPIFNTETTEEI